MRSSFSKTDHEIVVRSLCILRSGDIKSTQIFLCDFSKLSRNYCCNCGFIVKLLYSAVNGKLKTL